jgi:hypothetical protein
VKRRRRNLSQIVINVVGFLVVVSMVISLALVFIPPPEPTPTPLPTLPPPTTPPATDTPAALPGTTGVYPLTLTATVTPFEISPLATTARPTLSPPPTVAATATSPPTATSVAGLVATPIPLGSREVGRFTFAVCGDSRGGDEVYKEILRRVQEDGAAFLINTGDLVQSGQAEQFEAFAALMRDFTLPFFPVPGNHDARDGQLVEYLQYSGAPAAHYSFDYGLGHLVVVDSHSGAVSPQELAWLEADLAATDQPLKMVFLHHPPFDPDGTDHIMGGGNDAFVALVQKYAVSYVFAGHIHAYAEAIRDGVYYVVTGGGGAPLYAEGHPQAFYHYVRVTVDGAQASLEVVKVEP